MGAESGPTNEREDEMQRSTWIVLCAAVTLAACGAPPPGPRVPRNDTVPCIEVSPRNLEFDAVPLPAEGRRPEERVVTVSNACGGVLEIRRVQLGGGAPAGVFTVADFDEVLLQGDETAEFTVTFEPVTAGDFQGRVTVQSSDPDDPEVRVTLRGSGIAPRIHVTPDDYDYGTPYIGCEYTQPWFIANEGNADLLVGEITPTTASVDEFSVDLDPLNNGSLPFTIAPFDTAQGGPVVEVTLDYRALDTVRDEASLTFRSNDPFQPEVVTTATGTGTKFQDNLDVFEQPIRPTTDLLFTLDRSPSTLDDVGDLPGHFDAFFDTLATLDADHHTAVIVDDGGCVVGPDPYIDRSFSESAAIAAFRTMADVDFSLSPYGSNTQRGFMLAEEALGSENIGPDGCNSGLYREDAFLSIVHVSSNEEQSTNSWSFYVSLFQSLKADPEDVVVSAIAGDYPSGCGSAEAGVGYYEATVATGGLFLSICSTDWAMGLEDLATRSVALNDRFELSEQPVPQTLRVTIDGVRTTLGWEYDTASNAVVFDADHIPAGGSTVEVFYERMPDCAG